MTERRDLPSIGLIGAGNMGGALLEGLRREPDSEEEYRDIPFEGFYVHDIDGARAVALAGRIGGQAVASLEDLMRAGRFILLAVKPKDMKEVLERIAPLQREGQVFLSIAAGIPIAFLQKILGPEARILRAMPNTPALVGEGATAVAAGPTARPEDLELALSVCQGVGLAVAVDESMIDAVTGLSGSGPAYVFRLIEAMESAGQSAGLPAETARVLTLQTVLGAARLAATGNEDAAELRRRVTSPGGTTEAGLQVLEDGGFFDLIEKTVLRARERAGELGRAFD